jgi:hypothetical protein
LLTFHLHDLVLRDRDGISLDICTLLRVPKVECMT